MQNLFPPRCVQGPGRGELSVDAEQQEDGSPAHCDPLGQQVPTGPRVCLPFTLPHRDRAPVPAPADRHGFSTSDSHSLGATAGRAGGGESPLLGPYRLGPPVRQENWRRKPLGSNNSIGQSRRKLRLLLAAAERTLESSASSAGDLAAYTR